MQVSWRMLIPGGLVLVVACAGLPFSRKDVSSEAVGRVHLEFQEVHYDGEKLSGRLLIGVEEGQLRLNRKLIPDLHVEVRAPVDCQEGLPVRFMTWDGFLAHREEDLLTLERGYWFGREVDFSLFDEQLTGPGPECLKAELWLFSFDGVVAARQEIRAERSPRQPVDAGMPTEPADAGTP